MKNNIPCILTLIISILRPAGGNVKFIVRIIPFSFLMLLVSPEAFSQCEGNVSLVGKQFYDENGQPFYPMVMNYYVDFAYDGIADLTHTYIERTSLYGANGGFDYTNPLDGPSEILKDFNEMNNLGFNTVRLIMTPFKKSGTGFYLQRKSFADATVYNNFEINPPYLNDQIQNPELYFYFNSFLQVCSIAQSAGLKVMEVCADGKECLRGLAHTNSQVDEYKDFLIAFANLINDNNIHNLLAYEFYGEPVYAEPVLGAGQEHTKSQVCEIVDMWNSTVKNIDPCHLTTIGVGALDDPFKGWDPTLMKVDFANVHTYLDPKIFEWWNSPTGFLDAQFSCFTRYKDRIYEYDQALKRPYIIAETSFPGQDGNGNQYQAYPYSCYGDEAAQNSFVTQTFPLIKNSGASGYGWWDFQNKHWYPEIPDASSTNTIPLGEYQENYLGILNYGNPSPASGYLNLRKTAAQTFAVYVTNPPASSPPVYGPTHVNTDMTDPFYNPFSNPPNSYSDATHFGTMTGHVQDQNGNPIKGAVVRGASWVGYDNVHYTPPQRILYGYYTFTGEDGNFILRAYDYDPFSDGNILNPALDNLIIDMKIGAYGSQWFDFGDWGGAPLVGTPTLPYVLNSFQGQFDNVVDNVTIAYPNTQNFQGLSTLTAIHLTVDGNYSNQGGHSDLVARNEVELKPGFDAVWGSEVHIYNEPLFADCNDISNLALRSANISTGNSEVAGISGKEVEINFIEAISAIIYPNPNNGTFTLQLIAESNEKELHNEVHIKDCLGNEMMNQRFSGYRIKISNEKLKPGIYFMQVKSNEKTINQKFIIL